MESNNNKEKSSPRTTNKTLNLSNKLDKYESSITKLLTLNSNIHDFPLFGIK